MDRLADAVAKVRDRTSLYWAFYDSKLAGGGNRPVEVRLNGAPDVVQSFQPLADWSVHRVQWGEAVYLRRSLLLTEGRVEAMLIQMLELAGATGMQLHSWMHGPDVD